MERPDKDIFKFQGINTFLTVFAEEIIKSQPNLAANILLNIKNLADENHPLVEQAFILDNFENPELAKDTVFQALSGFNNELARLLLMTKNSLMDS
ncbi:hypothetical protein AYA93_RS16800 [Acinetobacter baumannii]|uniref:hypothetical protein n=1 Tax=Acinetobacter baumannii TaxID=470 RepID=UPI00145BA844|nr:hypothetical protein [Acinetobacter baumannii]EHU3229887.1 hypothetical protein [Acinetobacter baumannii]QJF31807.1 hypothetical protein HIN87_11085 [Acinetobacter baumannii]QJF36433.1 hypothetical protein HIN86_14905 [Acinetobacter baumannii]HEM7453423.1 hypothetical protein [Acinetobacter nosocomialis]